jgi:YebC/PmpR family DNA-binding regulatory protein
VFVECLTDNPQRTVANIRSLFNKRGGGLGTNGSVAFMFNRKGIITVPKGTINSEEFELEIIDAGAEDLEVQDDLFVITTAMEDFGAMQKKLEQLGIEAENASLQRIPVETKKLDKDNALKVLRLIDEFEDDDDVQNVYHNLEVTDEIMEAME